RLGRAPSEAELAKELNVTLAEYQAMLQEARGYELLHIEDFNRDEDDDYLARHLPDERENPFERYKDARFRGALVGAIEGLPVRAHRNPRRCSGCPSGVTVPPHPMPHCHWCR